MMIVALILVVLGVFLFKYIDFTFSNTRELKMMFLITGTIGFILTTILAFFLTNRITLPLRQLKDAAYLVSIGHYDAIVDSKSMDDDEIGNLARSFNHMARELNHLIQSLNNERDQLESVLRSMSAAVLTIDAKGRVVLANPPGMELLYDWHQFDVYDPAHQPFELMPVNDEAMASFCAGSPLDTTGAAYYVPRPLQELYERCLTAGHDITGKVNVHNAVWTVGMAPLMGEHGHVRGAVAVLRNITDEALLEKMRQDFIANVSHEIRTPLSTLQGYSEALLDDVPGSKEERDELVQIIHDEAVRMGRLVNDLLDLARMEAGHVELKLGEVNLTGLLERVYRRYSVYAKERGVTLSLVLPDKQIILPQADEVKLEQVVVNFLDNGLRHSESGTHMELSGGYQESDHGEEAFLAVRDEGEGIPAEDLPYIFERFYKADKARTRSKQVGGTGLGLAITKSIIEAHNGRIEVKSQVGQGSYFKVLFKV
jgi:two-component system sensor histidine kinase ResE